MARGFRSKPLFRSACNVLKNQMINNLWAKSCSVQLRRPAPGISTERGPPPGRARSAGLDVASARSALGSRSKESPVLCCSRVLHSVGRLVGSSWPRSRPGHSRIIRLKKAWQCF